MAESRSRSLSKVLLHLFREEWEHRLYAERDLGILEGRAREKQELIA